jgi:hypothetical protein
MYIRTRTPQEKRTKPVAEPPLLQLHQLLGGRFIWMAGTLRLLTNTRQSRQKPTCTLKKME